MSFSNRLLQFLAIFTVVFVCFKIYYKIGDKVNNGDSDDLEQDSWFLVSSETEVFNNWRECVKLKLMGLEDPVEFWKQFVDSTRKSDEEAQISKLGVTERSVEYNLNKNRFKKNLVSVPKIPVTQFKAGPHNFFTIGIGRDIRGEKQFRRVSVYGMR
ncbi:unnamed protein product [Caenorhabditis nigoni]